MKTLLLTAIFTTNLAIATEVMKPETLEDKTPLSERMLDSKTAEELERNLESTPEIQEKMLMSTGGGNGGDTETITKSGIQRELTRIKNELATFLASPVAKEVFSEVDLEETIELLTDEETFALVQTNLRDKFDIERDAVNYPEELKVFINQGSFESALGTKAIYVLVLHEVFGIQNVEVNNSNSTADAYKESLKLWNFIHTEEVYSLKQQKVAYERGLHCSIGSGKRSIGIQIRKSAARIYSHHYYENLSDLYNRVAAKWRGYDVQTSQNHSVFDGKNIEIKSDGENITKTTFSTYGDKYSVELNAGLGGRYFIDVKDASGKRYNTHTICTVVNYSSSKRSDFLTEDGKSYSGIDSMWLVQSEEKSVKYMNRNLKKLFDN